jgi:uncharacterized protein (TIGR03663 family)
MVRPAETLPGRLQHGIRSLTVEHVAWLIILLLATISRLWDLGSRALHHDESLHTYYSWAFSEGLGYSHHPMMHGPFLFHFNALSYFTFGANDYTSRLTAAVFGILLVMLPWLLRGSSFLGRWGALATSVLILFSPSLLYYSRFIRHDIFALVGAMLLFIAVVRYMEKPDSRWIILAVGSLGYVLTTHEVSFVNLFIFGTFTGVLILYRVLPMALGIIGAGGVLFLLVRSAFSWLGVASIPEIPWREPSTGQVINYLVSLLTHPVVVAGIAIGLFSLIVIVWLLDRRRDPDYGWIDGTLGAAPVGTTAERLATALKDGRAWLIGAVIGGGIFVVLYTSLFSNMGGLGSGTFGALGYWLGQHDVQRGEQPWFYYLVLAPQYEYLAILGSLTFVVFLAVYAWRRRSTTLEQDRRFYTLSLTAYWTLVMFLVLSWAGEKMPWLIVHFLLPMLMLAGGVIGFVLEWIERQTVEWRHRLKADAVYVGLSVGLLLISSFGLVAWASAGPFVDIDGRIQRSIREDVFGSWWIVYLPAIAAVIFVAFWSIRSDTRRSLGVAAGTICVLLLALQVNAAWNMTYREGDVPRDMLIYVQTSPDVHRTVRDLERFSHEQTGGMSLEVLFTGGSQWPLNWYLRDFTNRRLISEIPEEPSAPFIIAATSEIGPEEEERLANYSYNEFPLRWWIPEDETYRRFAIAPELNTEWRQNVQTDDPPPYGASDVLRSVVRSLASVREPEHQARLFRLIIYRELTAPIGGYSVRLYVHDDHEQHFNGMRYGYYEAR